MSTKVWFYLHVEQMRPKREKNITFSLSYCDKFLKKFPGISLAVQWLRLHSCTAEGKGLIPGCGIKILHAERPKKKKKDVVKQMTKFNIFS